MIHAVLFIRDLVIRDWVFSVLNILRKIRDASTELYEVKGFLLQGIIIQFYNIVDCCFSSPSRDFKTSFTARMPIIII